MSITQEQFETFKKEANPEYDGVSSDMIKDKTDRTLLYGYDLDRSTVHVYLLHGEIKIHRYGRDYDDNKVLDSFGFENLPSKRVYPESTDSEFLKLLFKQDIWPSFTTYDEKRYLKTKDRKFVGEI